MFLASGTMNIYADARGHERLALLYYPFTIEEEVTSDEEDVSVEKGTKRRVCVCAWSRSAAQLLLLLWWWGVDGV